MPLFMHGSETEVVLNSEGRLIKLHKNGTWEVLDESIGKVVFTIIKAEERKFDDPHVLKIEKDEFNNPTGYSYFPGIHYEVEIKNNTKYNVRIGGFYIRTSKLDYSLGICCSDSGMISGVLKPGDSKIESCFLGESFTADKKLTKTEFKEKALISSLDYNRNSLYIQEFNQYAEIIKIDPKSGVSRHAAQGLIEGNLKGVVALKKEIVFDK